MANEIRLRSNNQLGTITDNPLLIGATTINSPAFVDLPTVDTTNHLLLTLDPTETNGAAEIVRVTAHTAASSVVTVVRGAETTTPRQHPFGTTWYHGPVASDWTNLYTSGTRPTPAYEGQFIYETDTNKLMGFGGVDWAPRDAGGTLGYAEITANIAGITVNQDLAGLSVTVAVGTGRRIKVTGWLRGVQTTIAGDFGALSILEDGATINTAQNLIQTTNTFMVGYAVETPSAGIHTYKLQYGRSVGTGSHTVHAVATAPSFILVEDIGAV